MPLGLFSYLRVQLHPAFVEMRMCRSSSLLCMGEIMDGGHYSWSALTAPDPEATITRLMASKNSAADTSAA